MSVVTSLVGTFRTYTADLIMSDHGSVIADLADASADVCK